MDHRLPPSSLSDKGLPPPLRPIEASEELLTHLDMYLVGTREGCLCHVPPLSPVQLKRPETERPRCESHADIRIPTQHFGILSLTRQGNLHNTLSLHLYLLSHLLRPRLASFCLALSLPWLYLSHLPLGQPVDREGSQRREETRRRWG